MEEETNKRLGELIKVLSEGNVDALREIALIMERILYVIGFTYFYNKADVEDAIQNLYVTLYYKAKWYKRNKNACAWIIKIYENSIKNSLNRKKTEMRYVTDLEEVAATAVYDDNHDQIFVKELFATLNTEERKLLQYRYWCSMTVRDIANELHKPSSTIMYKLKCLEDKIKKFSKS